MQRKQIRSPEVRSFTLHHYYPINKLDLKKDKNSRVKKKEDPKYEFSSPTASNLGGLLPHTPSVDLEQIKL